MIPAFLLFAVSGVLRGLAQPGWLDSAALVLLAAALRILSWRTGRGWGWDFLHGLGWWSFAFSFLAHVHPAALAVAAFLMAWMGVVEGFLARRLARRLPWALAGALALAAAAWIRMRFFLIGAGGVPWASLAWPLADGPLLSLASAGGEGGLVLLVALAAAAVAELAVAVRARRRPALAVLLPAPFLGALLGAAATRPSEPTGSLRVLAVQPSIRVDDKHALDGLELYRRQLDLTDAALRAGERPDLVAWSETMWPLPAAPEGAAGTLRRWFPGIGDTGQDFAEALEFQRTFAARVLALAPEDAFFVTGAHFFTPEADDDADGLSPRSSQTLLFDREGRLRAHVAKRELVPFGERLPLWGAVPFARSLVDLIQTASGLRPDFVRPDDEGPLEAPGLPPLGVATCWENVFEEVFRDQATRGAAAFLVLSNEAWYGEASREMDQMLAATRLRAAETGRDVLRVTNSGTTVLVHPDGGMVRGPEPAAEAWWGVDLPLREGAPTPHCVAWGWAILPVAALLALLLALLPGAGPRRRGAGSLDHPTGEG